MMYVLKKMSTSLVAPMKHVISSLTSNRLNFKMPNSNENGRIEPGHKKRREQKTHIENNSSDGNLQQEDFFKSSQKTYEMPRNFLNDEFINDPCMMRVIRFILDRTAVNACIEKYKSNGIHTIELQKHEFIFGRSDGVKETGLSEWQLRSRMNRLRELGLIKLKYICPSYSIYLIVKSELSDVVKNTKKETSSSFRFHKPAKRQTGKKTHQQFLQQLSDVEKHEIVSEKPKVMNKDTDSRGKETSSSFSKTSSSFCPQDSVSSQTDSKVPPAVFLAQSCSIVQRKENNKRKESKTSDDGCCSVVPFAQGEGKKSDNETLTIAKGLFQLYGLSIDNTWVAKWVEKYGLAKIQKTLHIMDGVKHEIRNPGGWMQCALREAYADKQNNILENMKFIEDFIAENKIDFLKLNKKYCIDTNTGNDYQYNLPPQTFKSIIIKKYLNG